MLDVVINVEENCQETLILSWFGGSGTGVQLNTSISQENFLGTGKGIFAINTAKTTKNIVLIFIIHIIILIMSAEALVLILTGRYYKYWYSNNL